MCAQIHDLFFFFGSIWGTAEREHVISGRATSAHKLFVSVEEPTPCVAYPLDRLQAQADKYNMHHV